MIVGGDETEAAAYFTDELRAHPMLVGFVVHTRGRGEASSLRMRQVCSTLAQLPAYAAQSNQARLTRWLGVEGVEFR